MKDNYKIIFKIWRYFLAKGERGYWIGRNNADSSFSEILNLSNKDL